MAHILMLRVANRPTRSGVARIRMNLFCLLHPHKRSDFAYKLVRLGTDARNVKPSVLRQIRSRTVSTINSATRRNSRGMDLNGTGPRIPFSERNDLMARPAPGSRVTRDIAFSLPVVQGNGRAKKVILCPFTTRLSL